MEILVHALTLFPSPQGRRRQIFKMGRYSMQAGLFDAVGWR